MFSLFKKRDDHKQAARVLYGDAMKASRQPAFYERLSVPDTMDGRFDLLLVHVFLILDRLLIERVEQDALSQALFDVAFADVDQALREDGVGDMKISKHMKRMMLAFNGRMHAYDAALKVGGTRELAQALERNLYGTLEHVDERVLEIMACYMISNRAYIGRQDDTAIRLGLIGFQDVGDFLEAPDDGAKEVVNG